MEKPILSLTDGIVRLRPFKMSDVEEVTAACQDPEISRWTDAIPWPYNEGHALEWISKHDGLWECGEIAVFAIEGSENGDFLGSISLFLFVDHPPEAGYWVAAWGRNRGVATVALSLVTGWGFDVLGLKSVSLATMFGNVASERVAEKAGFSFVGETTIHRPHWYPERSINVKQWQLQNPTPQPGQR